MLMSACAARCSYEPLFVQYGVDLVIHGHVHAYERTNPVVQYKADTTGCSPTYVTIGDGGNIEKVRWRRWFKSLQVQCYILACLP